MTIAGEEDGCVERPRDARRLGDGGEVPLEFKIEKERATVHDQVRGRHRTGIERKNT